MSQNKTVPTPQDVDTYLGSVENQRRQDQARYIVERLKEITDHSPKMWGASLIGFDSYNYKHANGSDHQSFKIGLSPRKASLTIYINPGFSQFQDELSKLGPHKTTVSCLYITNLDKIDKDILDAIMRKAYKIMQDKYPPT